MSPLSHLSLLQMGNAQEQQRSERKPFVSEESKYAGTHVDQTSVCVPADLWPLQTGAVVGRTLLLPEGKQHQRPINELICALLIDSVSQKMDGGVTGGLRGTLVLLD